MLLIFIGAGLSSVGVVLVVKGARRFLRSRRWPRTTATVTGVTATRGMALGMDTAQSPTVQYVVEGRQYELESSGLDNVHAYSRGASRPLRYDPSDPRRAVVDLAGQNGSLLVLVAGLAASAGIALLALALPRV